MVDIASIASAAASIVGGVSSMNSGGGGESIRKQYKRQRDHVKQYGNAIRQGAENAGFNPLTYLAAMGPGGAMPGVVGGGSTLGSHQMIANGIATLFDDRTTEELEVEQTQKATDQLERIANERIKAGGVGKIAETTARVETIKRPKIPTGVINTPVTETATPAMSDEGTLPGVEPIYTIAGPVYPSGKSSDAEGGEARYGELAAELIGLSSFVYDLWNQSDIQSRLKGQEPLTAEQRHRLQTYPITMHGVKMPSHMNP